MEQETAPKARSLNDYLKYIPFVGEWLEPTDKVAVIRMAGVIADSSMMRRAGINYNKFKDPILDAFDVPRVKAVALVINSPGGAPAQCSMIATMITRLSDENNIPVFSFVEDVAASGGYWLACAGKEIYTQETSIVGSIGVISSGFGFDKFIGKHEIERRIHTSGRDKSFLDPFKPEKADDVDRLKSLQAEMHDAFKNWVRARRAGKLNGGEEELMEGAFWTGSAALRHGLIDGIGSVGAIMKGKFGDEIKFVDCSPEKKGILSQFLPFFGGEAKIGMDPGMIIDAAEERAVWSRFGL